MLLVALLDGADQRQWRGGRAAAGGGGDGGPAEAPAVAAADAAGLSAPCGLDAGADRHAGERARLERGGRCRARRVSASSSSRSSACRCCSARWRSSSCSASGCCRRPQRADRCRPTSAGMPGRWSSSIGLATACSRCACAQTSPLCRRDRRTRSTSPALSRPAAGRRRSRRQSGAPLRAGRLGEGDYLLRARRRRGGGRLCRATCISRSAGGRRRRSCEETLFNRNSGLAEVMHPAALAP